jgi:uncharacterized membrane protein YqjE
MATDTTEHRDPSVVSLVTNIISDAQELTRQQIELFKVEVQDGARKAQSIALLVGVGAALAVVAGVILTFGLAGWLASAIEGLPLWGAQLIVGAFLAAAAGILFGVCKQKLDSFSLVPEKSVEALKENLEWKTKPNSSATR